MQLNASDNGSRKFIQVQIPEETDEKSEAYKAGYKNLWEIGKERIRRAAQKIKEETLGKYRLRLPSLQARQQQYARCLLQAARLWPK